MRSSRQDTEKHRQEIIDAAAKLARERGLDAVSVPGLMAEIGMTHGGFYRHFPSKDALAPLAYERAFEQIVGLMETISADHPGSPAAALAELAETYLSPAHRDNAGAGCPSAALAGDMARENPESPLRQSYVAGVESMVDELEALDANSEKTRQQALVTLSTMVGALLLSRATRGSAISDELLAAARAGFVGAQIE
jgi:TetR/AcrR family transcriptional repressor of nem operon